MEDQKGCIRGCKEFEKLRIKTAKNNAEQCGVEQTNNYKKKLQMYKSLVKSTVTYEVVAWKFISYFFSYLVTEFQSDFVDIDMRNFIVCTIYLT